MTTKRPKRCGFESVSPARMRAILVAAGEEPREADRLIRIHRLYQTPLMVNGKAYRVCEQVATVTEGATT